MAYVLFLPVTPDDADTERDFAALLRSARVSSGLTQDELSTKAGVGVRTVRDLERGRASRPQRTTVELLATALGLSGEHRAAFVAASRGAVPSGSAGPSGRSWATMPPLPPVRALAGRENDASALVKLAVESATEVVTLVGLAGVGKSALGLAVLYRMLRRTPGGVAVAAVTRDAGKADLLAAIATAFGVAKATDLRERLESEPALLMIDGAEQSAATVEAVQWLRHRAPSLRILVTGRRPLGVPDERLYRVEPLEVPPDGPVDGLATLLRYSAAALFVTRLREIRREPVTDGEAVAVATLVRRLGGLPLALELAAARGRVLDAGELLDRYGDRLPALGEIAPRGDGAGSGRAADPTEGLRAAVAGSYELLDARARFALRRLSVLRGRWSVGLAEHLLAEVDDDPVALLDRLVALGLLTVRGAGPFRFQLLEVVREFAVERARAAGELAASLDRHTRVFACFAARTAPELAGGGMAVAIDRLDQVAGDLWAALEYATETDPATALYLASKLPRWWRFRGRDVPGRRLLRRLLDDPRTAGADPRVRAWARVGLAQLAQEHGEGSAELPELGAALAEFQALGSVTGELTARSLLSTLCLASGEFDEARRHCEAELALANRTERVREMAVAHNNLTWHDIRVGDLAGAGRRLAEVERLAAQCGEDRLRVLARANLAEVARLAGRYDEAVVLARSAAVRLAELGDPRQRRRLLGTIGLALAQDGRIAEAIDVLAELAADPPTAAAAAPLNGVRAVIEGWLAKHQGANEAAARRFASAASASASRYNVRDRVEALVGLAATCAEAERPAVLAELDGVCRTAGITLLPVELALLG